MVNLITYGLLSFVAGVVEFNDVLSFCLFLFFVCVLGFHRAESHKKVQYSEGSLCPGGIW